MTQQTFTPAMGRFVFSRLYDPVIALSREKYWRGLLIAQLNPQPGDTIIDVGCGTGTLVSLLQQKAPTARIIGVDPDESILALAKQKVAGHVEWHIGLGNALPVLLGENIASNVCSSLVLHQCPLAMKKEILQAMYAVLKPGGKLVIADFGQQRTLLMRAAFRIVQLADGKQDTQPNADGIIPVLMQETGFIEVREVHVVATIAGSISIYTALKTSAPQPVTG